MQFTLSKERFDRLFQEKTALAADALNAGDNAKAKYYTDVLGAMDEVWNLTEPNRRDQALEIAIGYCENVVELTDNKDMSNATKGDMLLRMTGNLKAFLLKYNAGEMNEPPQDYVGTHGDKEYLGY